MTLKYRVMQHISQNRIQYITVGLVFVIGLVMGWYKVFNLEGDIKSYLLSLIDAYLKGGAEYSLYSSTIFTCAFINQAKVIVAVWLLGLTVIGIPLILAVVFIRGYALGFTVGFLFQEKAGAGVLISIASILPQNLVYIPFLIIAAVLAVNFSLYIVKGRNSMTVPLGVGLLGYSLLMLIIMLTIVIGAFIEAYLSPWLLSLFL